jgi:hypothetical protein
MLFAANTRGLHEGIQGNAVMQLIIELSCQSATIKDEAVRPEEFLMVDSDQILCMSHNHFLLHQA